MYKKLFLLGLLCFLLQGLQAQNFTLKTIGLENYFYLIEKTQWGDYDNDGLLDLVVMGNQWACGWMMVFHNEGNGTFKNVYRKMSSEDEGDIMFVDYNNDNLLDVVYHDGWDTCHFIKNNGKGQLVDDFSFAFPQWYIGTFTIKDFNGDGKVDIAYYYLYNFYLMINNGDKTFTQKSIISGIEYMGNYTSIFLCADFDKNGTLDILLSDANSSNVLLLKNDGRLNFTKYNTNVPTTALSGMGNIFNDRQINFLSQTYSPPYNLTVCNINPINSVVTTAAIVPFEGDVYVGDLDNNSTNDLIEIIRNGENKPCNVFMQNTNKEFSKTMSLIYNQCAIESQNESSMPMGDYDNDGDLDILLGNNLYTNTINTKSITPKAPNNLRYTRNGSIVTLQWNATQQSDVTYNVFVKVNGQFWVSPNSNISTGLRQLVQMGNAGTSTQMVLNIPEGTDFEWGVQSINNSYVGSNFKNSWDIDISIAPNSDQRIQTNTNGTDLIATEFPDADTRQWKYGTSSITFDQTITGATSTIYTPNFSKAGTYYVVCAANKGTQTTVSNPIKIEVFEPEIKLESISTSPFLLTPSQTTTATVSFSNIGTYQSNNTFKVFLSDKNGSFSNPTLLTTSQKVGILTTNFPAETPSGTNYKIKIVSDFPEVSSNESSAFQIILNHKPTAIEPFNSNVDENASVGIVLAPLTATDVDENEVHTFTLINGNENFSIENNTLKALKVFDYETKNAYPITIKVNDKYGEVYIQSFNISINNINEAPSLKLPSQSFAGKEFTDISVTGLTISDVDAFNEKIQFTVQTQDGILKMSALNDNEIVSGKQSSGFLSIETTLNRANEILNSLIFSSNRYFYGTATISITVSDLGNTGKGGIQTTNQNLPITIYPLPPTITLQPTELIKGCMNQKIVFTVQADGVQPIHYQWYRNNTILYSEKSNTITFDVESLEDSGNYYCVVSNPSPDYTQSNIGKLLLELQQLDATIKDVKLCSGDPVGTILITATGGWGNSYTYSIDSEHFVSTNYFEKLVGGTYNVSVKDANNCLTTKEFVVQTPALLKPNVSKTDISCKDNANGQLLVNVLGGTPPFQLQISSENLNEPFTFTSNAEKKSYLNLKPDVYSVNIIDKNLCDTFAIITIKEPDYLVFKSQQTSTLCYGESNATVHFSIQGGTAPYNFYWTNQKMTDLIKDFKEGSYSLAEVAKTTGMPAGNYQFYITDSQSCSTAENLTIEQAQPLTIQLETTQNTTSVKVNGGTPTYEYSDGGRSFGNSSVFENLSTGYHQFIVRDAHLCSESIEQYIGQRIENQSLTADFSFISDRKQAQFKDASLNANEYFWDFGDGSTSKEKNPTHYYTNKGNYTVRLTIYNGQQSSVKEKNITIYQTTEVTNEVNTTFKVYPNPTQDEFTVSIDNINSNPKLILFDSSARKILEVVINQYTTKFSAANLAKGIYTIQLKTDTQMSTQKLVIY